MEHKESFFRSIGKDNRYVVFNLFFAYFALGVALIMLGSILPALKEDYSIGYQVGGMLLSVQSVGYAIAGLGAGFLPLYLGLKNSFILLASGTCIGLGMLLVNGNPVWLLIAMALIGMSKGAVTNYNNQIMTDLAKGNAGPLNLLHAFFAIGACIAPVVVLLCGKVDPTGWRLAVLLAAVVAFLGLLAMFRMKLGSTGSVQSKSQESKTVSYGFFKEKIFWVTMLICFFYQGIEGAMMGWLTSFFVDSHVMTDNFAQVVTSALWIALLVGRISCSGLASHFRPYQMIVAMAAGQLLFLYMLVSSRSFAMMMVATIGLGLSMSGMYGTSVSNAGDLFTRYPVCMGFFVLMTSMGAVVAPAVVGMVAGAAGMRIGLSVLLIAAAALVVMAVYNLLSVRKGLSSKIIE
ncbi:MAG: MFS transporter [Eubacteriales bacterium]|nr:MFS transporter [Eubacteriales bacterium]